MVNENSVGTLNGEDGDGLLGADGPGAGTGVGAAGKP